MPQSAACVLSRAAVLPSATADAAPTAAIAGSGTGSSTSERPTRNAAPPMDAGSGDTVTVQRAALRFLRHT